MSINLKHNNILVVDDYRTMLKIMGGLLRQLGFHHIDEATDGQMALDMLSRKRYSLVISDWNMEPMSGLALLKTIRATETIKDTPFIMITAENQISNVIAAKQAGTSNYIVKPFTGITLKEKIISCLGPV